MNRREFLKYFFGLLFSIIALFQNFGIKKDKVELSNKEAEFYREVL